MKRNNSDDDLWKLLCVNISENVFRFTFPETMMFEPSLDMASGSPQGCR